MGLRGPKPKDSLCFYCTMRAHARGLCMTHYKKHWRAHTLESVDHAKHLELHGREEASAVRARFRRPKVLRELEQRVAARNRAAGTIEYLLAAAEETEEIPADLRAWILAQPSRSVVGMELEEVAAANDVSSTDRSVA